MLIQYEQPKPQVALIRLNRPDKMNAFSIPLERELLAALHRACADEDVRVVVFAGAGSSFSGGWDLGETDLTDAEHHPLSGRAGRHTWLEIVRTLRRPDKVFIAAVHGWAAGQGLEMCIASDLIVCSDTARFYFAETRVGFNMTSGTAKLLPLLVGLGQARRLALLGQTINATEALRIGLVVEVTPEGQHERAALHLAEEALQGAPLAVAAQKQLLDAALAMSLDAVQEYETQVSFRLTNTEDHQEAKKAFAAKRRPQFKGR
ncbi:MAG TPA: enoyl-CoA hydratase/isomerase family protein [Candidatus Dormibacteraeota bacterium]|nr:enoyl-CoA hydratase/isomerase family protein [Candidatus Dormibacteraeota bacterium]